MKIAVIGAGAMGSIFGSILSEGGADVTLVDVSESLLGQIADDGVIVKRGGEAKRAKLRATSDPLEVGPVDIVLFFVKCYHTESAAKLAQPLIGESTIVASLQNGWGNADVLAEHFDPERLIMGITYHSGTVESLGVVLHTNTTDAPTLIGPYRGSHTVHAELLASAVIAGGLRAEATGEIRTEVWKKLVLNSATLPTSALTHLTAGALGAHESLTEVVNALARETVAVGVAQGLNIDADERIDSIHTTLAGAGSGKASMLQDVEGNRRTEIDVINVAVVRAAEKHDVAVPINRTMVALINGYETAVGLV